MGIPVINEIVNIVLSNPLLAYLFVLFLLLADSTISGFVDFGGVVGLIINSVVETLTGVNLGVTSFQILVVMTILPVILYAIDKSGKK